MASKRFELRRRSLPLCPALIVVMLAAGRVEAQVDIGNYTATGSAEAGAFVQPVPGTNVAKFREYQDFAQQVIAPELKLLLNDKQDQVFADFHALNVAQTNELYDLHMGSYGLLDIDAQWQEIPHFLSDDIAQSPYSSDGGNFTLPSIPAKPASGVTSGTNVESWVNSTAHPLSLSLLAGVANLTVRYTPQPNWTYSVNFNFQNPSGERPYGELFGPNPGTYNVTELAQPIEYDTYNYGAGVQYANGTWLAGFRYDGSSFQNQINTLTWQNPDTWGQSAGGACASSATYSPTAGTGPCEGRDFTYPDNQAHTFTLTGGLNLPMDTHLMANLSYGWWLQNQGFIPFTVNSALPSQPLPRQSLNGDVSPLFANFTITSRPLDKLRLKATYSYFDYQNHDPPVTFTDIKTLNDVASTWSAVAYPFSFSTQTIQAEASYSLTESLVASLVGRIETFHNSGLMVSQQDTTSYGPVLDFTPYEWLQFRGSYQHAFRDSPGYDNNRTTLVNQNGGSTEFDDLRRFDEATVNVNQFSLSGDVEPFHDSENSWLNTLTLSAEMDYDDYSYPDSDFGLQHWSDYTPSVGLNWAPLNDVSVYADYSWTATDWNLQSFQRQPLFGPPGPAEPNCPASADAQTGAACPGQTWTSYGREQGNSIDFGFKVAIPGNAVLPAASDLQVRYTYTVTNDLTHANGDPADGPATSFPDVGSRSDELIVNYRYPIRPKLALNIGYYFSHFDENDFGYDQLTPWMATSPQSIFLGDSSWTPFSGSAAYLTLKYKF
jgi:MtrB/PioB family decaheme-associated outer membrane protein